MTTFKLNDAQRRALPAFDPDVWHGPTTPTGVSGAMKTALLHAGFIEHNGVSRAKAYCLTEAGEAARLQAIAEQKAAR